MAPEPALLLGLRHRRICGAPPQFYPAARSAVIAPTDWTQPLDKERSGASLAIAPPNIHLSSFSRFSSPNENRTGTHHAELP